MKITNVKAMVVKMLTVGSLAAAVVIAAPTKAQAQVSFGVHIGGAPRYPLAYGRPVLPAPVYGYYGSPYVGPAYGYDFDRRHDWERRQEFYRREREERRDFRDRGWR